MYMSASTVPSLWSFLCPYLLSWSCLTQLLFPHGKHNSFSPTVPMDVMWAIQVPHENPQVLYTNGQPQAFSSVQVFQHSFRFPQKIFIRWLNPCVHKGYCCLYVLACSCPHEVQMCSCMMKCYCLLLSQRSCLSLVLYIKQCVGSLRSWDVGLLAMCLMITSPEDLWDGDNV